MIRCALAVLALWAGSVAAEIKNWRAVLTQGGYAMGRVRSGSSVWLDARPVPVAPDGWFVVGFDRDAAEEIVIEVRDGGPDAAVSERQVLAIAPRSFDIERIDGLPPAKVTPRTPEQIAKIRADADKKRQARADVALASWFRGGFDWPVRGRLSGLYGSQRVLNGEPRRPHYGVDVAAPAGTPVTAPADGVITLAESDMYFEGGLVFIDHGLGFTSALLHLQDIDVEVGRRVVRGEQVGTVGATGRATGPHLDWRISWAGRQVDPTLLAGAMPTE